MCEAWDAAPSDVNPDQEKPSAKVIRLPVKVFGSDVRDAQINHDFAMEIARLNICSADAGRPDDEPKGAA